MQVHSYNLLSGGISFALKLSMYFFQQFRAEGGLPRLVELLRSGNDEVRRSVAWAVLQCGNDLPTATEICRLG